LAFAVILASLGSNRVPQETDTLEEPVVNGTGKIHADDITRKITGKDCPAGLLQQRHLYSYIK
jgi:hypothetical protein